MRFALQITGAKMLVADGHICVPSGMIIQNEQFPVLDHCNSCLFTLSCCRMYRACRDLQVVRTGLFPLFFHDDPVFTGSEIGPDDFFLHKSLLLVETEGRLVAR